MTNKKGNIETSICNIKVKKGILHVVFKEKTVMEKEHIDEILASRKKIQQGEKMLVLADVRNVWQASKEARDRASSIEFKELSIATAILTDSLASRLLGNFFIRMNTPHVPTKLFKSEEKALRWLKTHSV